MTPYELDILFWYVGHAEDHPHMRDANPLWRSTVDKFKAQGLLQETQELRRLYELGERGRVLTDYICSLPLPRQTWSMS